MKILAISSSLIVYENVTYHSKKEKIGNIKYQIVLANVTYYSMERERKLDNIKSQIVFVNVTYHSNCQYQVLKLFM
jgi:hypothetical protein